MPKATSAWSSEESVRETGPLPDASRSAISAILQCSPARLPIVGGEDRG
jgi:hypothetical protein